MTPEQLDCAHQWGNDSGEPLACLNCGVDWPDDPNFPPPTFADRNPGYGALGDSWRSRVDRVVDELRRIA